MDWNTTYQLAEQHRNDMLKSAAEARLARTARNGNSFFQGLVARFTKTDAQPATVAPVETLPVAVKHTAAA
jgi:hypothetical protein